MASAIASLIPSLLGTGGKAKTTNIFDFYVQEEISRRQRSVDIKKKEIQADVDIKKIIQGEMTKRAKALNQSYVHYVNESDQILNSLDSPIRTQRDIKKGGRTTITTRVTPLSYLLLVGTIGQYFGNSPSAQQMGMDCWNTFKNIADKAEALARMSSASNLTFELPQAESPDQSMIPVGWDQFASWWTEQRELEERFQREKEKELGLEPPTQPPGPEVTTDVTIQQPPPGTTWMTPPERLKATKWIDDMITKVRRYETALFLTPETEQRVKDLMEQLNSIKTTVSGGLIEQSHYDAIKSSIQKVYNKLKKQIAGPVV